MELYLVHDSIENILGISVFLPDTDCVFSGFETVVSKWTWLRDFTFYWMGDQGNEPYAC